MWSWYVWKLCQCTSSKMFLKPRYKPYQIRSENEKILEVYSEKKDKSLCLCINNFKYALSIYVYIKYFIIIGNAYR